GRSADPAALPRQAAPRDPGRRTRRVAVRPRLAVTLGDPRGIGPEIVARALAEPLEAEVTAIGAEDQLQDLPVSQRMGVGPWQGGTGPEPADRMRRVRAGRLAGHALERAVRLALGGEVDAIVTGPVEKHALHAAGFEFPGQTEWLGQLA